MSATTAEREQDHDDVDEDVVPETAVVVRRRAALLLVLGGLSSGLAIAFLWRATGSGSWVDAVLCAVLGAMGAGYLTALIDARAPLLVADELGVRVRVGREWRGLPWASVERLWLLPRDGLRRDARLVVVPRDLGDVVEGLERSSVRSMQLTQRLHGAPLALPTGLTTRVVTPGDLAEDLRALCSRHDTVVHEVGPADDTGTPEVPRLTDDVVSSREAVVRALPGAAPTTTGDVSHVALVPEQPDDGEQGDTDGHDDHDDLDGEFSLLGRFIDDGPRDQLVDDRPAPERSDGDTRDTSDTSGTGDTGDASGTSDTGDTGEGSGTADDGSVGPTPWWHRVRRLAAGERRTPATADHDERDERDEHDEHDEHDAADEAAAADDPVDPVDPTGRPDERDAAPSDPVRVTLGFAPAASTAVPVPPPATEDESGPAMAPAAHVAVAPLVPTRSAARRVEVVHRVDDQPSHGAAALDRRHDDHGVHLLPESAVLRPGQDDLLLGPTAEEPHGSRAARGPGGATPMARLGDAVAPLVLAGYATRPAYDPVVGPEVCAARTRLGMSVDELAERTRIRPHVIEALEVDDFGPSGGDVYARGHLRTLGRVLGKDAEPWVREFDARYATGGTTARRVFEAELASAARPAHTPRSGPHWSLVAAVVLALGLVWAAASALGDDPVGVVVPAPLVAPEAGQQSDMPAPAPVRVLQLRAGDQAASVTVRDADGVVALATSLQPGETRRVRLALPVRVRVAEGGPVRLRYAGQARGVLAGPEAVVPGREGEAALPDVRRLR